MALNLWKIGGQPTSFNPLPSGWHFVLLGIGDYTVKFKAHSPSNAILRVVDDVNKSGTQIDQRITLNNVLTEYEFTFSYPVFQNFQFYDYNQKGDIIIEDIQLVQKPLPTLTINGIDWFNSGKWAQIGGTHNFIDDETVIINANTGLTAYANLLVNVLPNTQYTFTCEVGNLVNHGLVIRESDESFTYTKQDSYNGSPFTFKTGNNTKSIYVRLYNGLTAIGTFTFKRPMLNLGATPAPYERKRGEKMVLPTVKGNNLIQMDVGVWEQGSVDNGGGDLASTTRIRLKGSMYLKQGNQYTMSVEDGYLITTHFGNSNTTWLNPCTFTVNDDGLCRFVVKKVDETSILPSEISQTFPMLNEGTTAQPYSPYAVQLNKKPLRYVDGKLPRAKSGLAFNGVSDYLQLPSMTMDSVEIECLIETDGTKVFVDGRTGSDFWVSGSGLSKGTNVLESTSFINNQRQKIVVKAKTAFTDDVIVFANNVGTLRMKATLYKVTCYLAGEVVEEYDFENPSNLVGDKVLPNAKNLIPSFEDSRWSLHANADMLGKDVLRLEATELHQITKITLQVKPNTNYLIYVETDGRYAIFRDGGNIVLSAYSKDRYKIFNSGQYNDVDVYLSNVSLGVSTFNFVKPQLYELSGKEAQMMGKPTPLRKASKRTLENKR